MRLSFEQRFSSISAGVIELRDLAFFMSVTFVSLGISQKSSTAEGGAHEFSFREIKELFIHPLAIYSRCFTRWFTEPHLNQARFDSR